MVQQRLFTVGLLSRVEEVCDPLPRGGWLSLRRFARWSSCFMAMGSSIFRKASSICSILSPSVTSTKSMGDVRPCLKKCKTHVENNRTFVSKTIPYSFIMQIVWLIHGTHGAWKGPVNLSSGIFPQMLEQVGQHGILELVDRGHVLPQYLWCTAELANGAVMAEASACARSRPDQMESPIYHLWW